MNILRPKQAFARYGCSKTAGYQRIKDGLLPRPVSLGGHSTGVPEHELEAVLAARVAGRSDAEIRELVKQLEAQRQKAAPLMALAA